MTIGTNLQAALDEAHQEAPEEIRDLIGEEDAIGSLVDGIAGGILERLAMAIVVARTNAAAEGTQVDATQLAQGRAKVVEGLLLMVGSEGSLEEFLNESLGETPATEVLREYLEYHKVQYPEEAVNE